MCESCVAPLLIMVVSMFYKKDEQVHVYVCFVNSSLILLQGPTYLLVLCYGTLLIWVISTIQVTEP